MTAAILTVPRKPVSYRLDERIIAALKEAARAENTSVNRYVENVLIHHAKSIKAVPMSFEALGETRGGDRTSKTDSANTDE